MSLDIGDLSDDLVVRLTKVLARRPEYGIATPSRRWLQRQEERMKHLPKELLWPSSRLKRLAIKIADSLDPSLVDPQAVLCQTHSDLNPFLIRRLFLALAYEVTVHTDPLRSWPGRTSMPELSAFIGRIDSIAALWTEPQLFHEIYGLAPFNGHHVFVRSACEACCLAAVGASGRVLADLRAALIDRTERREGNPSDYQPRLSRVVEAWIDHLKKNHEKGVDRPQECRAWSEALLTELRTARPEIKAWRAKQRRHHAKLRASRRPVYAELRRTSKGDKITPLSASARHKRRTKNGIPIALADTRGAVGQRNAAISADTKASIYRPDSLSGYSEINLPWEAAQDSPTSNAPRPGAPEPARVSGPSEGLPTPSFLRRFEQEVCVSSDRDSYDDLEVGDDPDDERDYAEEEESRAKVQEWWANVLRESKFDFDLGDTKSVVSMVHPALRPSALPKPLNVKKKDGPQINAPGKPNASNLSVWTDITMHTVDPSVLQPGNADVPPVPRIPSTYKASASLAAQKGKEAVTNSHQHSDRLTSETDSKSKNAPLNWPAPPLGRHPGQASTLAPLTPLTQQTGTSRAPSSVYVSDGESSVSSSMFDRYSMTSSPRAPRFLQGAYSVASGMTADSSLVGSTRSAPGSKLRDSLDHDTTTRIKPKPATVQDWRSSWGDDEHVVENDSSSDSSRDSSSSRHQTRRPSASAVTQLENFHGKM